SRSTAFADFPFGHSRLRQKRPNVTRFELRGHVKNQYLRLLLVLEGDSDVVLVELRHQAGGFRAGLGGNGCNDLVIVSAFLLDDGDRAVSASAGNVEAVMGSILGKIV